MKITIIRDGVSRECKVVAETDTTYYVEMPCYIGGRYNGYESFTILKNEVIKNV